MPALLMKPMELAFLVGRWIDRGNERAVITGVSQLVALAFVLHRRIATVLEFQAVWAC